jgi:tetratricopeptide (TPR) repeat protein
MGAAYSENPEEKKQQYRKAIAYSERIMYLNSEFKRRVSAGQTVWDASEVLTINEADGMGWWTTTVFYYFKECIPDAFKIFNSKWITRNRIIMDKLEVVSPDWNGGANYFNFGIYYLALPDAFGGSLAKSAEYLQKAESTDPKRLLYPWGRAKYFYAYQKNRQGFKKDLEWVLAQDPHRPTGDTYPWNVYFQTQARELLSSIDVLF